MNIQFGDVEGGVLLNFENMHLPLFWSWKQMWWDATMNTQSDRSKVNRLWTPDQRHHPMVLKLQAGSTTTQSRNACDHDIVCSNAPHSSCTGSAACPDGPYGFLAAKGRGIMQIRTPTMNPENSEIRNYWNPELRKSRFPESRKSKNLEFRVSGIPDIRISGTPAFRKIQNLQICGNQMLLKCSMPSIQSFVHVRRMKHCPDRPGLV